MPNPQTPSPPPLWGLWSDRDQRWMFIGDAIAVHHDRNIVACWADVSYRPVQLVAAEVVTGMLRERWRKRVAEHKSEVADELVDIIRELGGFRDPAATTQGDSP